MSGFFFGSYGGFYMYNLITDPVNTLMNGVTVPEIH